MGVRTLLRAFSALLLLLCALPTTRAQIKFLLVTESAQQELNERFGDGLSAAEASTDDTFTFEWVNFTRKTADEAHTEMCAKLRSGEFSAVIDMAWGGWIKGRKTAAALGLPYARLEAANHLFVQAADDFMRKQNSVDAALIFEDQTKLDQVNGLFSPDSYHENELRIKIVFFSEPLLYNWQLVLANHWRPPERR